MRPCFRPFAFAFVCVAVITGSAIASLEVSVAQTKEAPAQNDIIAVEKSKFLEAIAEVPTDAYEDVRQNDKPTGKVEVRFSYIAKDSTLPLNSPIVIPWDKLEIVVDPNSKGMTISYSRQRISQWPPKVTLVVPTEEDKSRWVRSAEKKLNEYNAQFWAIHDLIRDQEAKNQETEKHIKKELEGEPGLVYPQ